MRLAILILAALPAFAQPTWSGVAVDYKTHTLARITGDASVASSSVHIEYDTQATPPFASSTVKLTTASGTAWNYLLGGLTPATQYWYRVCGTAATVEGCSDVETFTTEAAPSPRFRDPTLPTITAIPTIPTVFGTDLTYGGAGCATIAACITTAAAVASADDVRITLPAGDYVLTGSPGVALPARACAGSCGWILITGDATASQLPPPGVRVDTSYSTVMPRLYLAASVTGANASLIQKSAATVTNKWMFVGVSFSKQTVTSVAEYQNAVYLATQAGDTSSDFVFDRCLFVSTAFRVAIRAYVAKPMVLNSYIDTSRQDAASFEMGIDFTNATGSRFENNYIRSTAITLFSQEGDSALPLTSDTYIRRNLIQWNDSKRDDCGYNCRHHLEFKHGKLTLVSGNTFDTHWNGGNIGTYSSIITLTLRGATTNPLAHGDTNIIADLTISKNIFRNLSGFIGAVWGQNYAADSSQVKSGQGVQRLLFEHNLVHDMSGYEKWTGTSTSSGQLFSIHGGVEDFAIRHNTIFDARGNRPYIFRHQNDRSSGLRVRDNVFGMNFGTSTNPLYGGGFEVTTLTAGMLPAYPTSNLATWFAAAQVESSLANNQIIPGVIDTSLEANFTSAPKQYTVSDCTTYWTTMATNTCIGSGANAYALFASLKYADYTNRDFRWRYDSPYQWASDGLTAGVDMYALSVEQGWVYGPTISADGTKLRYETRDTTMQCYVSWDSAAWVADTPGTRFRELTAPGGTAAYRLQCAGGSLPKADAGTPAVFTGTL